MCMLSSHVHTHAILLYMLSYTYITLTPREYEMVDINDVNHVVPNLLWDVVILCILRIFIVYIVECVQPTLMVAVTNTCGPHIHCLLLLFHLCISCI